VRRLISTIGLTICGFEPRGPIPRRQQITAFPTSTAAFHLRPITSLGGKLFTSAVAVLLMVSLWFFIERTRHRPCIRATAENPTRPAASLLGSTGIIGAGHLAIGSGIPASRVPRNGLKNSGTLAVHGVAVRGEALIVICSGGLGQCAAANGRRADARHDRDSVLGLYGNHRARLFSFCQHLSALKAAGLFARAPRRNARCSTACSTLHRSI